MIGWPTQSCLDNNIVNGFFKDRTEIEVETDHVFLFYFNFPHAGAGYKGTYYRLHAYAQKDKTVITTNLGVNTKRKQF